MISDVLFQQTYITSHADYVLLLFDDPGIRKASAIQTCASWPIFPLTDQKNFTKKALSKIFRHHARWQKFLDSAVFVKNFLDR